MSNVKEGICWVWKNEKDNKIFFYFVFNYILNFELVVGKVYDVFLKFCLVIKFSKLCLVIK